MQVHFQEEGERLIARPEGRMEAADGADFAAAVHQRLRDGATSVTIDLEDLQFVDLGAVRSILRLARSLKGSQRNLEFLAGSAAVREALHQAGMNELFPFTPPFHSHRGTR